MSPTEIKDKVYKLVAEQLGLGVVELKDDSAFISDLRADSLDIIEMVMAFEEEFNIEIDDDEFNKLRTVGDVVELVRSRHQ